MSTRTLVVAVIQSGVTILAYLQVIANGSWSEQQSFYSWNAESVKSAIVVRRMQQTKNDCVNVGGSVDVVQAREEIGHLDLLGLGVARLPAEVVGGGWDLANLANRVRRNKNLET